MDEDSTDNIFGFINHLGKKGLILFGRPLGIYWNIIKQYTLFPQYSIQT